MGLAAAFSTGTSGIVCSADQALMIPGGFGGLSIFFRKASQTVAGALFDLEVWTAPAYFSQLDTDFATIAAAEATLLKLVMEPAAGLTGMTLNAAKVYGARIAPAQAMGTLLFWSMKADQSATIVGDIYVVPNHTGVLTGPQIARTLDASSYNLMGPAAPPPGTAPYRQR